MFPELDSIMTVFGLISPVSIPCLMMLMAGLSFMLPPGLSDSNLANSRKWMPPMTFVSLTNGVLPTADKMPSNISIPPSSY
jgi:hypothetical protein